MASQKELGNIYRKNVLSFIDDLRNAIELFVAESELLVSTMKPEEFEMDGIALRDWERRLTRIDKGLADLHRRIDA